MQHPVEIRASRSTAAPTSPASGVNQPRSGRRPREGAYAARSRRAAATRRPRYPRAPRAPGRRPGRPAWPGIPRHIAFASSTSCGDSAKNSSGSSVHGRPRLSPAVSCPPTVASRHCIGAVTSRSPFCRRGSAPGTSPPCTGEVPLVRRTPRTQPDKSGARGRMAEGRHVHPAATNTQVNGPVRPAGDRSGDRRGLGMGVHDAVLAPDQDTSTVTLVGLVTMS
jgi:hypothetical protein